MFDAVTVVKIGRVNLSAVITNANRIC